MYNIIDVFPLSSTIDYGSQFNNAAWKVSGS